MQCVVVFVVLHCDFHFQDESPVTAVVYSSCGKRFATGHQNGTLRLWEGIVWYYTMTMCIIIISPSAAYVGNCETVL